MINIVFAAFNASSCNQPSFFDILPHWWEYLKLAPDALGQCTPQFVFPNDLLAVGLAVIDIMLRLAGFLAVISIIIAGISHMFTGGSPEKASNARKRLMYALLGLVISMIASGFVTFIGRQLT